MSSGLGRPGGAPLADSHPSGAYIGFDAQSRPEEVVGDGLKPTDFRALQCIEPVLHC